MVLDWFSESNLSYGIIKMIIDLAIIGDLNISASAVLMFMSALLTLLIGMVVDGIAVRRSYAGQAPRFKLQPARAHMRTQCRMPSARTKFVLLRQLANDILPILPPCGAGTT